MTTGVHVLGKLGSTTLAAALVAALAVPAAAAPDDAPRERQRALDSLETRGTHPDDMPLGEGAAAREYFVRLSGAPAALHVEDEPGRPALSRWTAEGQLEFGGDSPAANDYRNDLAADQAEVASTGAAATVGRELDVLASYTVANHGFATEMTPIEARALADHPDVVWVQEFPEYLPTTDRGPGFVGARDGIVDGRAGVWERPAEGAATGVTGQGVIVGIIDTGINPSNPSFAAVGADGHVHRNPFGAGNYVGSCDPEFTGGSDGPAFGPIGDALPYDPAVAELCNDKLIGMYGYASVNASAPGAEPPYQTPIDHEGHGSHTAGTAAGSFVDGVSADVGGVEVPGNSFDISGVAPHANVISYGACCTGIALVSAIDQMIVDGIDVLNFSIGSTSPTADLLEDALTYGFLVARLNGVHVANSAGNAGPGSGTVGSPADAPWVTSVASSTHDRLALNAVTDLPTEVFDDGRIDGKGVSAALDGEASLVYAGDLGNPLCRWNEDDDPEVPTIWDEGDLDGTIVVCDRGLTPRVEKAEVAAAAGAVGFVLANDEANQGSVAASLNGDSFVIPGVHVTYADGEALKAWMVDADDPTASVEGTSFDVDPRWGDSVSIFSSRGPNGHDASLLSPQLTAPGTDILAAWGADDEVEFQFASGTSMSAPHVAGALALLVDGFGGQLTPAEAQSALQLTARRDVTRTDGVTPADAYDVGSGHADVAAAMATGLVMDVDPFDFLDTVDLGLDASELNLASMAQSQCVVTCSFERTLTGAPGTGEVTYTLGTEGDVELAVAPAEVTVSAGEDVTIEVTADVDGRAHGEDVFGTVTLTPDEPSVSDAHLPVVVRPSPFAGPERLEIVSEGYVDSTSVEYVAADASELQVDVAGLTPGEVTDLDVAQDPTPLSPFSDVDESAIVWLEAPEGVSRIVAEVGETTSPDIDLFVGRDLEGDGVPQAAETRCVSAAAGSDERCDLLDPEPGSYWVLVQNWESSDGVSDPTELVTAVVTGDEGNLTVDAPPTVDTGASFDLDLAWALEPDDKRWYGLLELGSGPDAAGEYPVPVDVTVVPEAPIADAGGPYRVTLGENLTLDGSGSSHPEDVPIDEHLWDVDSLGISSPQEGEVLTVRPVVAGEREVTLTVTADGVTDTDTVTVVVDTEDPTDPTDPTDPDPPVPACDQVPTVRFPDVPAAPPHGGNIGCIAGFGIAQGRADGTFGPAGDVRRDQMASFLARTLRVAGVQLPGAPSSSFPDVTGGPHALAIAQLADVGVVQGRPGGAYDPGATVTRAQMGSFLVRALEVALERDLAPSGPGRFTDIGGVHADNIRVAAEFGIAQGRTATTFAPNADVQRGQMGSFLARSLDVLVDEGIELTRLR